jgi:hypothetical protein
LGEEGKSKGGEASLTKPIPPLLTKERGNKGVRFINNLKYRLYNKEV